MSTRPGFTHGSSLAQVFGNQDPALSKLDAEKGQNTPMPQELRKRLDQLKKERSKK